ncbi:glycosyltransferase family 4 protein [Chelatococcus sp. GCM10030263]|uniref:glycosyltransferase family 4 protein n=1 Tax=Chelatococcus sp. GCM10030263 TaxID=3273387 RepID=UPI0036119F7C
MTIPVAFYAPLKPPDHPVPSGDRRMAQLLMRALAEAGFAPELASRLTSYDGAGNLERQRALQAAAEAEAERLIVRWRAAPAQARPRLFFTYHVYYKAPDWIGPRVAAALGIPYVVAEGTRAPKRAGGPWAVGHRGTEAALDAAEIVFVMAAVDRPALEVARPSGQSLANLPPFIETGDCAARDPRRDNDEPQLLTVAMMRAGDKLASYRLLAAALERIAPLPWRLTIVGDGPARIEVERLFAPFGERVMMTSAVDDPAVLARIYAKADLFVWPAVNEAYGMVFLEAEATGCPVIAGAFGGVPGVVKDGETGILTPPGDVDAFAAAVAALLGAPERRSVMGRTAAAFVRQERSLEGAAAILRETLSPLVAARFVATAWAP